MNQEHFDIIKNKDGFIAALDQSGGSTPKALNAYGVSADQYSNADKIKTHKGDRNYGKSYIAIRNVVLSKLYAKN